MFTSFNHFTSPARWVFQGGILLLIFISLRNWPLREFWGISGFILSLHTCSSPGLWRAYYSQLLIPTVSHTVAPARETHSIFLSSLFSWRELRWASSSAPSALELRPRTCYRVHSAPLSPLGLLYRHIVSVVMSPWVRDPLLSCRHGVVSEALCRPHSSPFLRSRPGRESAGERQQETAMLTPVINDIFVMNYCTLK